MLAMRLFHQQQFDLLLSRTCLKSWLKNWQYIYTGRDEKIDDFYQDPNNRSPRLLILGHRRITLAENIMFDKIVVNEIKSFQFYAIHKNILNLI